MEFWIDFNLIKPPVGTEVLAKCEEWIDEDFNQFGIRIGFLDEDDDGPFISAKWNNYADHYDTVESNPGGVMPTHWRYKDKDSHPITDEEQKVYGIKFITEEIPPAPPEKPTLKTGGILYCSKGKYDTDSGAKQLVISKIGREYIYAAAVDSRYTKKISKSSLTCDMGDGTGYKQFFLTEQEVLDDNEHRKLTSKINSSISYTYISKLSLEQLRQISNILNL